jgi:hypothetical protein
MRRRLVLFASLFGAGLACGDVTAPSVETDGGGADADPTPSYVGVWQVSDGTLWSELQQQLLFLELRADGTGQLYSQHASGVLGCGNRFIHAPLDSGVVSIDLPAFGLRAYRYQTPDAETLVLRDPNDAELTLSLTSAVPDSARCVELTAGEGMVALEDGLTPHSFSGLATANATTFWFASDNGEPHRLNPTDGSVGPALPSPTGFRYPLIANAGNYWAHCGCGGSPDLKRIKADTGEDLETIDTTALGDEITIRAGATTGSFLWLGGYGTSQPRLLKIGGTQGARTLEGGFDFSPAVKSLAGRGEELWAIVNDYAGADSLVHIDVESERAIATYVLPADVDWQALGYIEDRFWALGISPDYAGVLIPLDLN